MADSVSDDRYRQARAFQVHVRILCDKLILLKRRESTKCSMVVTTRKVADAQGDTTNLIMGLHQSNASLYYAIRLSFEGAFVKFSRRLKEGFDCKARSFQQDVSDTVLAVAESTRSPLECAPGAMGQSQRLIVGRVCGRDKSARRGVFVPHCRLGCLC